MLRPLAITAPAVTVALIIGPVAAGLLGAVLPAAGHMPEIGRTGPSLEPLRALLDVPGIGTSALMSVWTGLAATALSLAIVVLIFAGWWGSRMFRVLRRGLSPVLAVPHAAAAFGLAFLIAPSGWFVRLLSPWATGWERPPDALVIGDPWGIALTAGLVVKELPFLFLMALAALPQTDAERRMRVAQSLGRDRVVAWLLTVLPAVYVQIRLPVYAVLAFSMSVVDMALILGPSRPPTLAVQILAWMADPQLEMRSLAAGGALLQMLLVVGALIFWRRAEILVAAAGRSIAERGLRPALDTVLRPLALLLAAAAGAAVVGGLAALFLWSVAGGWAFPAAFPETLTLRTWERAADGLGAAAWETALVALASVLVALVLTVACLETETRRRRRITRAGEWLLYTPLLVPQIAFLPGLQVLSLRLGLPEGRGIVILTHLVFVLPYVFLSLGDAWRAWDLRNARVAAGLGTSANGVLFRLRLPMLLAPLLTAAAVGAAVSVGQYLPTLIAGGGRVPTLTTEAVALASGGDRRLIGTYAVVLTAAAWLPFAAALAVPELLFRNRRGLHG